MLYRQMVVCSEIQLLVRMYTLSHFISGSDRMNHDLSSTEVVYRLQMLLNVVGMNYQEVQIY